MTAAEYCATAGNEVVKLRASANCCANDAAKRKAINGSVLCGGVGGGLGYVAPTDKYLRIPFHSQRDTDVDNMLEIILFEIRDSTLATLLDAFAQKQVHVVFA
jgi:hypothetical protein